MGNIHVVVKKKSYGGWDPGVVVYPEMAEKDVVVLVDPVGQREEETGQCGNS
jgi:hypothetical protein